MTESRKEHGVTLVIPARNAGTTLDACLGAVVPRLGHDGLCEVIVVDDASTDDTAAIARRHPVTLLCGEGRGAGPARNRGWRQARTPLVWFVDADCVVEPESLRTLRSHLLADPEVAGVSGTFTNPNQDSLLARLIQQEIAERHRGLSREVDFLATGNVLYRRAALDAVGGFDERYRRAEDMELACRMVEHGYSLRFEPRSRAAHPHARSLIRYLRTQAQEGYWRVWVYRDHPNWLRGDSYSGHADHVQPPLALVLAATLPFVHRPWGSVVAALIAAALVCASLPMSMRMWRGRGTADMLSFALLSSLRALPRGLGLACGVATAGLRHPGADPQPETSKRRIP